MRMFNIPKIPSSRYQVVLEGSDVATSIVKTLKRICEQVWRPQRSDTIDMCVRPTWPTKHHQNNPTNLSRCHALQWTNETN